MEPARGGTHFRHPMKKAGHFILFKSNSFRNGFTLIETIIVLGVLVVISVVMISSLFSRRGRTDLDNTARQIAALLREAQGRSVAGESGMSWGVHFENATTSRPFYALFRNIYGTSTRAGLYTLPLTVGFSTSTIAAGSSTDVVFGKVSGFPSASTKIGVFLVSDLRQSSTITVATSGSVSY